MAENAPFLPGLSPVCGKPVHLTFDGGRLTSDAGVLVLAEIERRLGLAERLARCLTDPQGAGAGAPHPGRDDPLPHAADRGRLPGRQRLRRAARSTRRSRWRSAGCPRAGRICARSRPCAGSRTCPAPTALKRMMAAMVELFCDSFEEVPRRIVLDIDDTEDRVHGQPGARALPRPLRRAAASCRSTSTRRSRASRWR